MRNSCVSNFAFALKGLVRYFNPLQVITTNKFLEETRRYII